VFNFKRFLPTLIVQMLLDATHYFDFDAIYFKRSKVRTYSLRHGITYRINHIFSEATLDFIHTFVVLQWKSDS